jgi:hypothetical protein
MEENDLLCFLICSQIITGLTDINHMNHLYGCCIFGMILTV